jgi:WD40 repeat protein
MLRFVMWLLILNISAVVAEGSSEPTDDSAKAIRPVPDERYSEPPVLTLNTSMFAGSEIRALAISHDDSLLAVGGNKEVKLWNIASGRLIATLRGYREPDGFSIGNVNSVAFTPDNRYLIVGVTDNSELGSTRLYDLHDPSTSLKLLPGHTGCTIQVAPTPDGKAIATYGCFGGIKIYELDVDSGTANTVDLKPSSAGAAKAREDQRIAEEVATLSQQSVKRASYFGFPSNDEWILQQDYRSAVVVSNRKTRVYSVEQALWPLEIRQFCQWESALRPPGRSDFTSDMVVRLQQGGGYVRGGLDIGESDRRYWVGVWNIGESSPRLIYTGHRYSPSRIAWSPSNRLIASSDLLGDIHVWSSESGESICHLRGDNSSLFGVDWIDDHQVKISNSHFGADEYNFNHFGPYSLKFNLRMREFSAISESVMSPVIRKMRRSPAGSFGADTFQLSPERDEAGKWILKVTSAAVDDDAAKPRFSASSSIMSYAICGSNVIVGSERGELVEIPVEKNARGRFFRGHSGIVTGVAVSPDRQILASSSTDGTIRFWSLRPAPDVGDIPFSVSGNRIDADPGTLLPDSDGNLVRHAVGQPIELRKDDLILKFDDRRFYERKRLIAAGSYRPGQIVPLLVKREDQTFTTQVELRKTDAIAEPLLTLFLTGKMEWAAWTPSGHYDASPNGEQYVGWHVNQGREHPASFFQVGQFRKDLYRPDLISTALNGASIRREEVQRDAPFPPGADFESGDAIQQRFPPVVRILSPEDADITAESRVEVRVEVVSAESLPEQSVEVTVNGRPTAAAPLERAQNVGTVNRLVQGRTMVQSLYSANIVLSEGPNVITAKARHYQAESNLARTQVVLRSPATEPVTRKTRRLYVLAVGVSEYEDPSINLKAAHHDAQDFAEKFRAQQGLLFDEVHTRVLSNEEATVKNIKEAMGWLSDEATDSDDTAFILLSGHGFYDKHRVWRLMTHDVSPSRHFDSTTLTFDEIRGWFESRVPANAVLFVDACHASGVNGAKTKGAAGTPRPSPWQGTGRLIFSSCKPDEQSLELEGHGAFTEALLEALSDPGSTDILKTDGYLSVHELIGYLTHRVPQLTNDRQHPTLFDPGTTSEVLLYQFP